MHSHACTVCWTRSHAQSDVNAAQRLCLRVPERARHPLVVSRVPLAPALHGSCVEAGYACIQVVQTITNMSVLTAGRLQYLGRPGHVLVICGVSSQRTRAPLRSDPSRLLWVRCLCDVSCVHTHVPYGDHVVVGYACVDE